MEDTTLIRETGFATGAEINSIISKIAPVISGYPPDHQLIACLSICFIMMNPHLDFATLQQGVGGASNWISDFIEQTSGLETQALFPGKPN